MSLSIQTIHQLFADDYLREHFVEGDYEDAIAALPDASLEFLLELCRIAGVKTVFEFGSGRSTKALL
jgi:hypothetical protein